MVEGEGVVEGEGDLGVRCLLGIIQMSNPQPFTCWFDIYLSSEKRRE